MDFGPPKPLLGWSFEAKFHNGSVYIYMDPPGYIFLGVDFKIYVIISASGEMLQTLVHSPMAHPLDSRPQH